jgi:hypothetical protein
VPQYRHGLSFHLIHSLQLQHFRKCPFTSFFGFSNQTIIMHIGKIAEPSPHKIGLRPRPYAMTPPATANAAGTRYKKIAGEKMSAIYLPST